MKANEIHTANTPGDEHTHGHRYKLLREIPDPIVLGGGNIWLCEDTATGAEHIWRPEHFKTALVPSK